ncbi:MAG: hypothetical protein QW215_03175 [Ignisphaera sp.]
METITEALRNLVLQLIMLPIIVTLTITAILIGISILIQETINIIIEPFMTMI